YDENYATCIDRSDLVDYADCANLVPLVKGIAKLVEQRQFHLGVSGSFKKEEQALGLTFEGSTQFDIENKTGDGVISIKENESQYSKKPVHTIRVGVDQEDVRLSYNSKLNAKFTIQTIKDLFGIVIDLMEDQNGRIYQWFGDKIDNMNETILMRVINGEYGLLFHNIIKEVELTNSQLSITISGKIFNLEDDITVEIGFDGENISFVHLVNFEAIGYVVDLRVDVLEWDENYYQLPTVDQMSYYDLSDIKTLAQLGLNVANMDYFHIKGTANIQIDAVIDISSFAKMKDLPVEVEVFENNGDVCIKGTLEGIPTLASGDILAVTNAPKSSLDFYYEGGYFYLTRHSYDKKGLTIWGGYKEITDECKTTKADFVDNMLGYLMGWGMRLQESSLIWNSIKDAIEEHADRTEAMDYASLLESYSYTSTSNSEYGNHKWDIGLNIAELANNTDLKSCSATIYGKEIVFDIPEDVRSEMLLTDPNAPETLVGDYLTHLDASLLVKAKSILTVDMSASLNLIDIDPFLTYEDFETATLTAASYAQFRSYVNSHVALNPVYF
ncbi:MAG: hypothetical protein K6E11_00630, partial [Bacilli bacterium]|nr:hypothetical protein [Bacilli bacterium]